MNQFEKNVRKALIDREMSLSDLAKKLGISSAYLYDILKSARKASHQKQKIKDILKMVEVTAHHRDRCTDVKDHT